MIGEPEMSDEPGGDLPGAPAGDLLGESDGPLAATAALRKPRPWLWAVGGIAVASAVWAAVLHGTGGAGVDLHGYHLGGNPCGGPVLKPLQDAVGAQGFGASDATVSKGPALDKLSCVLSATGPAGDGWVTSYTVSVDVELHKKTDPRAEFENTGHARVSTLPGVAQGSNVLVALAATGFTSGADVRPVPGIGDEAYLVDRRASDQDLEVLHGGAVLSLQVTGYSRWNGPGVSPTDPAGQPRDPDLTRLRPAMTTAMRRLMTSLAS